MTHSASFAKTKALSFDIYGTLIDWEGGILPSLEPLTRQLPPSHPSHPSSPTYFDSTIAAFNKHETRIIAANPKVLYGDCLNKAYLSLGEEWGLKVTEQEAFSVQANIPNWEVFPDTVNAMQRLGKRFKLVALSNISNELIAKTIAGPLKDVKFDAVYTAEDIGSYKPDLENFAYLLRGLEKDLGLGRDELVHVAHGVKSDQEPAAKMDIDQVWIRRNKDNWDGVVKPDGQLWWETLGDMADAIEQGKP